MRTAIFWLVAVVLAGPGAQAEPVVALEAITDRRFYRERVRNEIHIEARVSVAGDAGQPAVRNVAFVLDRSGSMAGERIAAVRAATAAAWAKLAAEDFGAIVVFGSEVETLLESRRSRDVRDVETRLAEVEPVGGAALFDALNQAAAQVRRHAGPQTIDRLILITDGPPTKGPREAEDFTKLAEALAHEGISITTIGLGPEFGEDVLSAMARAGHGRFHYASEPGNVAELLLRELTVRPTMIGRDAVLTVEFKRRSAVLRSYGWREPTIAENRMSFRFPRLLSEPGLRVLVSAEVDGFDARYELPDFAVVRLRWTDAAGGELRELMRTVAVQFSGDSLDLRDALVPSVAATGAEVLVREGLQKAIEALDRNDVRRAWRELRAARTEVRDLDYELEDARVAEVLRSFDRFLTDAERAGVAGLNRKELRAGLGGRFDPPAPVVEAKR